MSKLTQEYLLTLTVKERQTAIVREFLKCQDDPIYCLETYFTVMDPTVQQRVQFELYPHQIRAVSAFEEIRYNMTMKSRQMGLTTIASAYAAWFMSTKSHQVVNALSNKLIVSRRFLKQVRDFLDDTRKHYPWLIADYVHNNNGKDSFALKTGCVIRAESNTPDACRGEVINLLLVDESCEGTSLVTLRHKETAEIVAEILIEDVFKRSSIYK